jgi:hypothetical protein
VSDRKNFAAKLRIHKIEQGQGSAGCHPRGVQIFYKESTTIGGDPNQHYLRTLLERHGFEVTSGVPVKGTPIQVLCVTREKGQITNEDVEPILRADPEIEFVADELDQ